MAAGVELHQVQVTASIKGEVSLVVSLTIKCESELEAIGWLVSKLEEE